VTVGGVIIMMLVILSVRSITLATRLPLNLSPSGVTGIALSPFC
jgi:hypothetical protein